MKKNAVGQAKLEAIVEEFFATNQGTVNPKELARHIYQEMLKSIRRPAQNE